MNKSFGVDRLDTPERVNIDRHLATIASRALAMILDSLALILIWIALALLVFGLAVASESVAVVVYLVGSFLTQWFYFAFFEWLWQGQTPGKRALKLRVQKVGGYPIHATEAFIRNMIKPFEIYLLGVGAVVMLMHPKSQRIGDLVAGTVVVNEGHTTGTNIKTYLTQMPAAEQREVTPLTLEEEELIQEMLTRGPKLYHVTRRKLYSKLVQQLKRAFAARGLEPNIQTVDDEEWLVQILKADTWEGTGHGPS